MFAKTAIYIYRNIQVILLALNMQMSLITNGRSKNTRNAMTLNAHNILSNTKMNKGQQTCLLKPQIQSVASKLL